MATNNASMFLKYLALTVITGCINSFIIVESINKRAKRALGRSPEDKVKGYSGAIYRGPLMLSTKYWKRTSR